ncbi:MAG: hypothetical protein FWD68_20360 [Alphaproteobacteria bacterium]|nr:hypothetical protein [Alphaproteobacteria bacterium]
MGTAAARILELQDQIAQNLVDAMSEPWERIVVNLEMEMTAEGPIVNYLYFYISQLSDGDFKETEVDDLPNEADNKFRALNDAVLENAGNRWGICDLVIEKTGKYKFKYDYGQPKRLNNILDESSYGRFNNYLDAFRAERAAQKGA